MATKPAELILGGLLSSGSAGLDKDGPTAQDVA